MPPTEETLQNTDLDIERIRRLTHEYSRAIDNFQLDDLVEPFGEDAVFDLRGFGAPSEAVGHEVVRGVRRADRQPFRLRRPHDERPDRRGRRYRDGQNSTATNLRRAPSWSWAENAALHQYDTQGMPASRASASRRLPNAQPQLLKPAPATPPGAGHQHPRVRRLRHPPDLLHPATSMKRATDGT